MCCKEVFRGCGGERSWKEAQIYIAIGSRELNEKIFDESTAKSRWTMDERRNVVTLLQPFFAGDSWKTGCCHKLGKLSAKRINQPVKHLENE
ncbi:MAG: hypothetical protein D6694_11145 [Gammaproteobacteria bacterium]|nr:MAG: hypothetical protein D6694_11145 [Gammaproteobacteria bacterium]